MKVVESMTRAPSTVTPEQPVRDVAKLMATLNVGSLPVSDGDRLVGIVTDRDIAIRGVAAGKQPDTAVREIMTDSVKYCFEDQSVEDVARNMGAIGVRRLPVVDRKKRLVGILSLGDIARTDVKGKSAGAALHQLANRPAA